VLLRALDVYDRQFWDGCVKQRLRVHRHWWRRRLQRLVMSQLSASFL
jgi:uncharacterized PurR-regulated membrane protein YhhQ (DUF165 family)